MGPVAGDENGHFHPWVREDDGSITIGATDGHTHTIVSTDAPTDKGANTMAKAQKTNTIDVSRATEEELKQRIKQL